MALHCLTGTGNCQSQEFDWLKLIYIERTIESGPHGPELFPPGEEGTPLYGPYRDAAPKDMVFQPFWS